MNTGPESKRRKEKVILDDIQQYMVQFYSTYTSDSQ